MCKKFERLELVMALRGLILWLVMLLVASTWTQNAAESGCSSVSLGMSPCMDYAMGLRMEYSSTPSTLCCSTLSKVVQSSPQCLCTVLNGDYSLRILLNQTLTLSLPSVCKLQTPPGSRCKAEGFNIVPATDTDLDVVGSSDGSTIKVPFYCLLFLLPILSLVSMF